MTRKCAVSLMALCLPVWLACGARAPAPDSDPAAAHEAGGGGGGRNEIRIVGSSTVYPFATKVAERFGRTTSFPTPIIESTGSGGGLKLFCAGVGVGHPDITNASRAIKSSEVELCRTNGVDEIVEIKIGYDGIVVANALEGATYPLTRRTLFLALAKQVPGETEGQLVDNPYETWHDVSPELPPVKIEVYGPPPTSGTRDALAELALEGGCRTFGWIAALEKEDGDRYKAVCHSVREDGAYVEAGENDNLIVQKLEANSDALGVFGFSFLDQNRDKVKGSSVDDVEPTFEAIAAGEYPVSRPLFFYVKKAHVGVIPGIEEYVAEFVSEAATGDEGYLAEVGLIPLPADESVAVRAAAETMTPNVS